MCQKLDPLKKRLVLDSEVKANIQKEVDEHESHVKSVKNELLQCVMDSNETEVFTFELQRPLEIPCLSVEESYDWRQLWLSNVCIYDEVHQKAYMCVWDETVSRRGPEEIASCLLTHILSVISKTTTRVILYSKSPRLYRNMSMSMMLKKVGDFLKGYSLKTIEQRFFLRGHDSNDCNRCFEAIEKQIRATLMNKNLSSPTEWCQLISSIKQNNSQFTVINMTEKNFYSVAKLMQFVIDETHSTTGQVIH